MKSGALNQFDSEILENIFSPENSYYTTASELPAIKNKGTYLIKSIKTGKIISDDDDLLLAMEKANKKCFNQSNVSISFNIKNKDTVCLF